MSIKRYWLLGGSAVLGLLWGLFASALSGMGELPGVLTTAREGLRALSLSGFVGNLLAWGIVALIASPPVLVMAWRWRSREKGWWDCLAVLASLLIVGGLYALVNPTQMPAPVPELAQFWPAAYGMAALSALLCWVIVLFLNGLEGAEHAGIGRALSVLLLICSALLVFGAVSVGVQQCAALMAQVAQGNSESGSLLLGTMDPGVDIAQLTGSTNLLLVALAVLELIPSLLGAVVLLWSADLVDGVRRDLFGEETVALCEKMARGCRWMVLANVGVTLCANLVQLAAFPYVAHTSFRVQISLLPLVLSAALFLLCRLFQRGRQLQQDSESII